MKKLNARISEDTDREFREYTKLTKCVMVLNKNNKKISLNQLAKILRRLDVINVEPKSLYKIIVEYNIIDNFQRDTKITGYGVNLVDRKIRELCGMPKLIKYVSEL